MCAFYLGCAQVSGDIALGCRWRVSPLDVLALQVRGRQEELDHKQELVAIIKDWWAAHSPVVLETWCPEHRASVKGLCLIATVVIAMNSACFAIQSLLVTAAAGSPTLWRHLRCRSPAPVTVLALPAAGAGCAAAWKSAFSRPAT